MIMIFMGFGWPRFSEKYLAAVSARFTANSSICEMATGNGSRLPSLPIDYSANNYSGPNS